VSWQQHRDNVLRGPQVGHAGPGWKLFVSSPTTTSSSHERGCARCTECATMGRHENGECRSRCAIFTEGRRMTSRRGIFAFSDLRLGTEGMAPARVIHVIRSVPSEMRGSQGLDGPLARDLTTRVMRAMSVQIRRSNTLRPKARVEGHVQGLQRAHLLPRVSPGQRQAIRFGRVPCRWRQAILCWDSRPLPVVPRFCLPASCSSQHHLVGAWLASGSSRKIFLVRVAQNNCEKRPASHQSGIAAVAWEELKV
jgi:hypothetical protein